jgi:hypothetical protein
MPTRTTRTTLLPEEVDRLNDRIRELEAALNWNAIGTLPKGETVEVRAVVTIDDEGNSSVREITHWRPYEAGQAVEGPAET